MTPLRTSRSRLSPVVRARHAAWADMHRRGLTPTEIARAYGVDPTTVTEALDKPVSWRRKNARKETP